MRKSIVLVAATFVFMSPFVRADQTAGEAGSAAVNKVETGTKEGVANLKGKLCKKGDTKCEAEAAKEKAKVKVEKAGDKVKETVDKVD